MVDHRGPVRPNHGKLPLPGCWRRRRIVRLFTDGQERSNLGLADFCWQSNLRPPREIERKDGHQTIQRDVASRLCAGAVYDEHSSQPWLGVSAWNEAYDHFYQTLNGGANAQILCLTAEFPGHL